MSYRKYEREAIERIRIMLEFIVAAVKTDKEDG